MQYQTVIVPGCPDGVWAGDTNLGLSIVFSMGCGPTYTAPSAGAWLNNNYLAAPGQVNACATNGAVLRIAGVLMLPGETLAPPAARAPLLSRSFDQELLLCQRHYQKSYNINQAPAVANVPGFEAVLGPTTAGSIGSTIGRNVPFKTRMRTTPTVTVYSYNSGAAGKMYDAGSNQDLAAVADGVTDASFRCYTTSVSTICYYYWHWIADARF